MPNPPPWPGRPSNAQNWELFWLVRDLPPLPFPDESYDYGEDMRFGPPGTRWVYQVEDLIDRETFPGATDATRAAVKKLLAKLRLRVPNPGSAGWVTPEAMADPAVPVEQEALMPMHWIRCAINGAVGLDEQVVHVINLRHSTTENAAITSAELKVLGDKVRDAWLAFFGGNTNAGAAIKAYFSKELTYKEVRSSLLVQPAPGEKPNWPLPTVVSPFAAGLTGTGTLESLPYEVAMGVSLNTNWRGTSRFRGRTYLGPLAMGVMGATGQFNKGIADAIGTEFGESFLAKIETDTDYEAHIVSQKFGTSAKVTGVRMGVTPDSQRRRRRGRPENFTQVWGTPVGAL